MAKFETKVFMCRASRPIRLYRSVYDANDCAVILQPNKVFTSRKQYIRDHVTFYHITESDVKDVPTGYWCTGNALQTMPVTVQEKPAPAVQDDGTTAIMTELKVKARGAVVYQQSTGNSTIPCDLALGDQLVTDRQSTVNMAGIPETRYRIASLTSEDQSLVGGWIAGNSAVQSITDEQDSLADIPMLLSMVPEAPSGGGGGASTGAGTNTTPSNNANNPTWVVVPTNPGGEQEITLPNETDTAGDDITNDDAAQNVEITIENYGNEEFMKKLYESYGMTYFGSSESSLMSTPIGRMIFVHGMPFQFTHLTDRRGHSKNPKGAADGEYVTTVASGGVSDMYGRTFAKEIASNMPIAVMVPGKPKFLTNVQSGLFRGADGTKDVLAGALPEFLKT